MSTSVDVFQAIAHPLRRRLLDNLAGGEASAGELAGPFAVSRPAVSQHLRVLREAGLVSERRAGRERIYRLRPEGLREVHDWVARYDVFWTNRLERLGRHLDGDDVE